MGINIGLGAGSCGVLWRTNGVATRPGWTRPGFELTAATFQRVPGVLTAGLLVITELKISVTICIHA